MRKVVLLFLALSLMTVFFAACGTEKNEEEAQPAVAEETVIPEPATTQEETSEPDKTEGLFNSKDRYPAVRSHD